MLYNVNFGSMVAGACHRTNMVLSLKDASGRVKVFVWLKNLRLRYLFFSDWAYTICKAFKSMPMLPITDHWSLNLQSESVYGLDWSSYFKQT